MKEERGTILEYKNIPKGMYAKPFIIPFHDYLMEMSDGKIDIDAVNTYTVGNYENVKGCPLTIKYSHMISPNCKFVNSWWGIYLIYDDPAGKGANFILKNPKGQKDALDNLKIESIQTVPMLDQKLITWSSHENQKDYPWEVFQKDFIFKQKGEFQEADISDLKLRKWKKIYGEFETNSALTDTKKTDMHYTTSIRAYIGLPDESVYKYVEPWYPFVLKGEVVTRYFSCKKNSFWAIVYYNGSEFINKEGKKIDTWRDVQSEFQKSFYSLKLDCG
ncbi:MAG: hypothetical protein HS129_03325 [Leptospiraceae bacterium]|nr:hypothetical protein [Leptospiraceae bacterium]